VVTSATTSITTLVYGVVIESPTPPDPQSTFSTPPPTSRISSSRAAATPATPAEPLRLSITKPYREFYDGLVNGLGM
jgi:hypothetical protein